MSDVIRHLKGRSAREINATHGTRLWPASRETYPKQLLPLTGPESLLQITARRLEGFAAEIAKPIVVTNEEHRFIIAEQMRQIGKGSDRIVL
ncbi:sugar phosphate nucleotidyltransferase, partial [Uliginosibacterium sp. 31-12]|nr:sugar phosphate nucleotidyltransferase [Uliginosibacterium sp. 31-12]